MRTRTRTPGQCIGTLFATGRDALSGARPQYNRRACPVNLLDMRVLELSDELDVCAVAEGRTEWSKARALQMSDDPAAKPLLRLLRELSKPAARAGPM